MKRLVIYCSDELYKQLEETAEPFELSPSQLARVLLASGIKGTTKFKEAIDRAMRKEIED